MHSFIITGGGKQERTGCITSLLAQIRKQDLQAVEDLAVLESPDTILIRPQNSIAISSIRDLIGRFKLKPFAADQTIAIIEEAQLLSIPAQHALLKTLEEPAQHTYLILELENPYRLLETIRSRCQIILASGKAKVRHDDLEMFFGLSAMTPGQRLEFADSLVQRDEDVMPLLRSLLEELRLRQSHDSGWVDAVKITHDALRDLTANVNPALAIQHFALNFRVPQAS